MRSIALVLMIATAACLSPDPYQRVTTSWTRTTHLQTQYQQALEVAAIYKSAEWRAAYAEKDAEARGLTGPARDQVLAQARADAAGPIEIELLVTTWDRRENDLDRGDKSSWRVRLLDASGTEVAPLEIRKDKRPYNVIRAEFPAMNDFAVAYVARFPRPADPRDLRLRLSSERGGVEVAWGR